MKKIKACIAICLSIIVSACTTEDIIPDRSEDLTLRTPVIYEYAKAEEAQEFASQGLIGYIEDFQKEIINVRGAEGTFSIYVFTNGQVIVQEYGFIDENENFLEHYILNYNQYEAYVGAPVPPSCPEGSEFVGECRSLPNLYSCIGGKMAIYAMSHQPSSINSVNHGFMYSVVNTGNSIRICAQSY